jgi:hypothetical protein
MRGADEVIVEEQVVATALVALLRPQLPEKTA